MTDTFSKKYYLATLNPAQREAALHTEGPLLVLAGAGSGKTKMLISRMAHLIEDLRVPPYQILAVTFTNKAASEMRERMVRTLSTDNDPRFDAGYGASPEIGTFHSICVRILRREGAKLPFTKPFVIYDDADQLTLLKAIVKRLGLDEKTYSAKSFQYAIDRAKCDAKSPDELELMGYRAFEKHLPAVYAEYQKDLIANNAVDFGDLIAMTYKLLRDHPDVRARYQHRYRYIHVDEYQDTNRAQYLLLSLLASRKHGGHENICVVGDEDQSIYKWRGADIRNILDFEHDFPGACTIKLEQNYRSTQNIISAASRVISNNTQRKNKTLWTDNPSGDLVRVVQLQDERQEAEYVVGELDRMLRSEGFAREDFAIFYRTHAQSRQFEETLRRYKIPYQIVGGLRFYDRKEIKDVLSYFKLLVNPSDSVSLKRVINVPARGIGKTSIEKLEKLWQDRSAIDPSYTLWDAIDESGNKKMVDFKRMVQAWIDFEREHSVSELYHRILDDTRYVTLLKMESTDEALARIENLEEFDTLLKEFEEMLGTGARDSAVGDTEENAVRALPLFLEQTSLATDAESAEDAQAAKSSVKLMTLHSSKGLEFPVVFMVGMEEGLFPSVRAGEEEDPEDIEEERRLCYVGMTRARKKLIMSHVSMRRIWGNFLYQYPARFLDEIPVEFVEKRDLGGGGATRAPYTSYLVSHEYADGPHLDADDDFGPQEGFSGGFIGRKIRHPQYGVGKILDVEGSEEAMDNVKITIEFADRVRKKFYLRFVQSYLE